VLGSLLGGAALSWCAGAVFMAVVPSAPIPPEMAERAMARESAAAVGIGLTPGVREQEELRSGDDREIPLPMQAGECVAVIAASSGTFVVESIVIADAAGRKLVDAPEGGVARQAQWCAETNATWRATIDVHHTSGASPNRHGTLHYAIARGRPTALFLALNRAVPTAEEARRVPSNRLMAISDRRSGGRAILGQPIRIASFRARLVPETPATYARLHSLASNGVSTPISPRFDPLPDDAPANWRPSAAAGQPTERRALAGSLATDPSKTHAAVGFVDGEARRVLAVIDPSILPHCTTIHFVRMLYGYRAHVVRGDGSELSRDHNVAEDRLCPGGRPRAYLALPGDQERYVLRMFPE
jgi:hypothetical protein